MNGPKILIMAGGTGGHVFPALAVARELAARGARILWLGTRNGMEADLVPKDGFAIAYINISGLRGKGPAGWLMAPFRVTAALFQALRLIKAGKPDLVMGMGGFVTGPGGVAARILRKPLVIHEQNAVAGLTNRILSRIANRVLQAFPGTFGESRKTTVTGNPVRSDIAGLPEPAERYRARSGPIRLLVIGGSLGAQALNQTLPRALAQLPEAHRPQVLHQTGRRNYEQAVEDYRKAGVEAELKPFLDDMAQAYSWADLVLCRSGALTVSELAAAGVPAVLVPYPFAVDDHQTRNGRFLADAGAALLIQQERFNAESLAKVLTQYCAEPEKGRDKLLAMAARARSVAQADATLRVTEICSEMVPQGLLSEEKEQA